MERRRRGWRRSCEKSAATRARAAWVCVREHVSTCALGIQIRSGPHAGIIASSTRRLQIVRARMRAGAAAPGKDGQVKRCARAGRFSAPACHSRRAPRSCRGTPAAQLVCDGAGLLGELTLDRDGHVLPWIDHTAWDGPLACVLARIATT